MEETMESKINLNEANPTVAPRIDRRTVLKGAAAGFAATTLGPISKRSTFAAPAFLQGTNLVFALTDRNAPQVQPLVDDYAKANNVTIELQPKPFPNLLEKLTLSLTQSTGAYDVVSMDDPWMPQFAGGEFLMNLNDLMTEQGIEPDEDFVPELLALGDYPPGSGLRGIPWVGNVQVFAWRSDVLEELGLAAPPA